MPGMLAGGARRLLTMFGVVGGVTLLGSLGLGTAAGVSARRSIALGCYLVGSFLLLSGFFVGSRGVVRAEDSDPGRGAPVFGFGLGRGRVRSATREEQRESIRISGLVISLGIALLILGVLADSENNLV